MPSRRSFAIHVALLAIVFAVAFGVGYVYEYHPERDRVELVVDRTADIGTNTTLTSGTVVGLDAGTVTVRTDSDLLDLSLSDVPLEGLVGVDDASTLAIGSAVNMGGERTATERVITGIVFVDQGEVRP